MSGWMPIETAPDGDSPVLVFCPDERGDEQIMIAVRSTWGWSIYIDGQRLHPTHWMPLPAPPEIKP